MARLRLLVLFLLMLGVLQPTALLADALVVTKAMSASTIAEIFVEEGQVRLSLEIGAADAEAFADILPDALYRDSTGQEVALDRRAPEFLSKQWKMVADQKVLAGRVTRCEVGRRIERDEITGQPIVIESDEAERVARVEVLFALANRPAALTFDVTELGRSAESSPPTSIANIGFVAYHNGVAINDFRYLSNVETLRLDWEDPWYSAFERKNLKRRFDAPAAAFLYIEHLEVRKEVLFRPRDLQRWVDLGLEGATVVKADQRSSVCALAAEFLHEQTPLLIDGKEIGGTLDRVHFVTQSLRTTGVVPEGQDVSLDNAMIGAIYVYPVASLPKQAELRWELFDQRISRIPAVATDQAGGMPSFLSAESPTLVWTNHLKSPKIPAMRVVPPPTQRGVSISLAMVACMIAAVTIWMRKRENASTREVMLRFAAALSFVFVAVASSRLQWLQIDLPLGRPVALTDSQSNEVMHSLLHNVYRAFDYRDESTVYNVLDQSVSGELLTEVYLETRRSLTLASQGGARVKVKQVDLVGCEVTESSSGSFSARCVWDVAGSVGHWGHLHERRNQYVGTFAVKLVDGAWKLAELNLESESRI